MGACKWASLGLVCAVGLSGLTSGCRSASPRGGVTPETQQRSQETYGRQQRSMDSFNQTPSEQAGERFEHDTRPVRPVEEEEEER